MRSGFKTRNTTGLLTVESCSAKDFYMEKIFMWFRSSAVAKETKVNTETALNP